MATISQRTKLRVVRNREYLNNCCYMEVVNFLPMYTYLSLSNDTITSSKSPSMKVMEIINKRTTTVSGGCVVYCLNVTSGIKEYYFQINRLLQTEVKRQKTQAKKEKNAKFMALQCQSGHLIKDKRDCRILQLLKQFVHSWRHLKRGL